MTGCHEMIKWTIIDIEVDLQKLYNKQFKPIEKMKRERNIMINFCRGFLFAAGIIFLIVMGCLFGLVAVSVVDTYIGNSFGILLLIGLCICGLIGIINIPDNNK